MKKSGQNTHTQKTERERKKFIAHKTLLLTADLMHTSIAMKHKNNALASHQFSGQVRNKSAI